MHFISLKFCVLHIEKVRCCFFRFSFRDRFYLKFISLIREACYGKMVEVAEVENLDFKWGKKRGIGGKKKDVQFYESFTYDGVEYTLYDCVYLYKEGDAEPHVGKLIKIWENADKAKKVKLLWFFRPSDISNFLGNVQTLENELILACGEGVGLTNINPLVIKLQ